jgi:hypothetical protein
MQRVQMDNLIIPDNIIKSGNLKKMAADIALVAALILLACVGAYNNGV